jgi:hypothetical protein
MSLRDEDGSAIIRWGGAKRDRARDGSATIIVKTQADRWRIWIAATIGLALSVVAAVASQSVHPTSENGSEYFPLSVGNTWRYALEEHSRPAGKTITWRVMQKEVDHGVLVYHLWPTPAQGDDTLDLCVVHGGVVEWSSERFVLKNPLRTGDRWSDVTNDARVQGKLDAFEVMSAGNSCSVGGHSFDDCATIREDDDANSVTLVTTYARGVGPVRYVYFKALHSKEVDTVLTIKSWELH